MTALSLATISAPRRTTIRAHHRTMTPKADYIKMHVALIRETEAARINRECLAELERILPTADYSGEADAA